MDSYAECKLLEAKNLVYSVYQYLRRVFQAELVVKNPSNAGDINRFNPWARLELKSPESPALAGRFSSLKASEKNHWGLR